MIRRRKRIERSRKPIARRSKRERPRLKREIDAIYSRLIRALYGEKCVVCGSTANVQCGHIFTATHEATRWELPVDSRGKIDLAVPINAYPQCRSCNFKHEHDAYPYMAWFTRRFGTTALDDLHRRHFGPSPFRSLPVLRGFKEGLVILSGKLLQQKDGQRG
jgi:hypothetical protein